MVDDDDVALKQIKRRTSPMGKAFAFLFVVGAGALAYTYIQRSQAREARMDGVLAAGQQQNQAQMLAMLRAELERTTYDDVQVRIIRNLGHFRDNQAVPVLTQALDNAGKVRRAAALALARVGSPAADAAKPKLLSVLPHSDQFDRPQVVWALAVLGERAASEAILDEFTKGLLQGQPDFDAKIVANVLGVAKLASPELTGHKEESVRALTAMALAEAASPKVVEPLIRMISNKAEKPEVVRAAASGLARTGDPRVAMPLFQLMQARPKMRVSVIDALKKSTAAPEIAKLLASAKTAMDKRDLVAILRSTHDPRSADTLAQLVSDEDPDARIEAAHALAELGDPRSVPVLLELAKDEDDTVGQDAIDALRELGHPAAAEGLLAMLPAFPGRKASLLRALGATHATKAGPAIQKELKGDDVAAAAKALGQIPYSKAYGQLVRMLKRNPEIDYTRPSVVNEMSFLNRRAAIVGLGYYGTPDPRAIDALIAIVEDTEDDFRLRRHAGQTLGLISDTETKQRMLSKIMNRELDEAGRVSYVHGLWQRPDPAIARELVALLTPETPTPIRIAAGLAIGYAADPANDEKLIALLDQKDVNQQVACAVVLGGSEEAAQKLVKRLREDRDLREVLQMAVNNNENDYFNLITEGMFESGQVWRRLRVAEILKQGDAEASYSYAWTTLAARLNSGWQGADGISPRKVRARMYKALTTSPDKERRRLAGEALAAMNQRGLLLAARDSSTPGANDARQLLLRLDRPKQKS